MRVLRVRLLRRL